MTATNHEVLLVKVRKLLAMAEGTDHPDEADAFSRKAAELIAAHRLDPERVAEAVHDDLGIREYSMGRGAYVRARIALLQAVASAHGCQVVFAAGYGGTTAYVAGYRTDLETTDLLYTSLHAQASGRMAGERRRTGAATQQWRRSFLFGFAHQAGEMLERSRATAEREVVGAADRLPALRAREVRVTEHLGRRFGRIGAARSVASPTSTGYVAGRKAAAGADLGRKSVPGHRSLGRGG
jgi:hypothetical protein